MQLAAPKFTAVLVLFAFVASGCRGSTTPVQIVLPDGSPAVGAWVVPERMNELQRFWLATEDLDQLLRADRSGRHTDDEGWVSLDLEDPNVAFFAIHEEHRGISSSLWLTEEPRVELLPSLPLVVRVLDPEGRPCSGVPVHLMRLDGGGWFRMATTGEDGTCEVIGNHPILGDPDEPRVVYLDVNGGESTLQVFDPSSPPLEPIELIQPDVGRIRIVTVGEHGEPVPSTGAVALNRPGIPRSERWIRPSAGEVWLDDVAVGCEFEATLFFEELPREQPLEIPVVTCAGETLTATIDVSRPVPGPGEIVFQGTVVLPRGQPVVQERVHVECKTVSARGTHTRSRDPWTNPEGRFLWRYRLNPRKVGDSTFSLRLDRKSGRSFTYSRELPEPLSFGLVDLGTIHLVPVPE